jgi:hypothetical protein
MEQFALPLDGYYRSTNSAYDTLAFFKLYPDSYWLYTDLPWVDLPWVDPESFDYTGSRYEIPACWSFNFLAFLQSLDVTGIKARYPNGHCAPEGNDFHYQAGLYHRNGNRLHLTSCSEAGIPFAWGDLDVTAPGRLYSDGTLTDYEFVPESGPETR